MYLHTCFIDTVPQTVMWYIYPPPDLFDPIVCRFSVYIIKVLPKVSFSFMFSQAEFSEINVASTVSTGCVVDMQVTRGGTKVVR